MSPASGTAAPITTGTDLWVDSLTGTAPEFLANPWRPRTKSPLDASWTEDPREYEWLENSTAQQERPGEIDQKIETLFGAAKEQVFEDGMESEFSRELVFLVQKYGNVAMEAISELIVSERVNAEVASEALRWLGRMEHSASHHYRLRLLERGLFCSSALVRDGAALGLASLDDTHAMPYLMQAIQLENCAELREDMEQVLYQLENVY